jgi:PIN domain nuclease of toxin-antitoxin system
MSKVVLDASALFVLINDEPGTDHVASVLSQSVMSAVTVAEVLTVLKGFGMSVAEAQGVVRELVPSVVAFDMQQAALIAGLAEHVKNEAISFSGKACLALGKLYGCPILTAEESWKDLGVALSLDIRVLR